jgi:hypothetical protein
MKGRKHLEELGVDGNSKYRGEGVTYGFRLVLGSDQWQILVNMAMKLKVPFEAGRCLSTATIVKLPERAAWTILSL